MFHRRPTLLGKKWLQFLHSRRNGIYFKVVSNNLVVEQVTKLQVVKGAFVRMVVG
jgi:hypothetical protein